MATQMVEFMKIAECNALVYTASMGGKIDSIRENLSFLDYLIPVDASEENASVLPFQLVVAKGQEALEKGDTAFLDHEIDMGAMCAILFTSGTSGTSKGVMLSHGNLTAAVNASCDAMQYDRDDSLVSVLPIHHTYELTCGQFAASNLGSSSISAMVCATRHEILRISNPLCWFWFPCFWKLCTSESGRNCAARV